MSFLSFFTLNPLLSWHSPGLEYDLKSSNPSQRTILKDGLGPLAVFFVLSFN